MTSSTFPPHSSVFKTHIRVVAALTIREMTTRYGRKIGGYFWAILDPVAFIGLMSIVFSSVSHTPPIGRSFMLFYATGYLSFWIYRTLAEQTSTAVKFNKSLLTYPVVTPYDAVLARAALQIVTQFIVCTIIFGGMAFFITPFPSIDFANLMGATIVATGLGFGIGLLNTTLFNLSGLYERIFTIANRPLFLISGVFFLPDSIPTPYRDYLLWNPIVHIIGWFRRAFYPAYRAAYVDETWLISLAFGSTLAGLVLLKIFGTRLRESE
ncbi:ABC transporter permease [Stappia sp. F7233]|uniref:ABC transporter permease n=1 Tax=Stappia albiluteola TaxID=2758565 RepID=A0A839AB99_9HYPH|nr:ABC transporter permease [Stappia albiluteola]MBA5776318.1 ABC transporter permease [Stappia albiluteola]